MRGLIETLVAGTGLSENDIRNIIRNAPIRYKSYLIAKRSGGERLISQPAREVKALQRVLISEYLRYLPVHPCATAYRPGKSIRDNATAHATNGPILKFDFKNFFPSIVARDWKIYCDKTHVFENYEDLLLSTKILFHQRKGSSILRLAIGAPSSPWLSNILMSDFDARISELVKPNQVTYTRYADDLTFSAKRTGYLNGVEKMLRRLLRDSRSPTLTLNEEKTVLATRKYKRLVTGLILSNDGRVSLGYERKRKIRAALHHAQEHQLSHEQELHLAGLLAFVQDVEPDFLVRLTEKYGDALITHVRTSVSREGT